jgi:hypothetical protein
MDFSRLILQPHEKCLCLRRNSRLPSGLVGDMNATLHAYFPSVDLNWPDVKNNRCLRRHSFEEGDLHVSGDCWLTVTPVVTAVGKDLIQ